MRKITIINNALIFHMILYLAGILYYSNQIELHARATHHSAGRIRGNKTCRSAKRKFNCVVCFYYIPVTVYRYCYSYLINLSLFNYLLRIIITKFNSFIILLLLFRLSSSFSCLV